MKIQPEWIEWKGGECPVDGDAYVAYELRGNVRGVARASFLGWHKQADGADVIAYCPLDIEPYKPKPKWEVVVFQTDSAALLFKGGSLLRFSNTYTAVENAHRIADALNAAGVEL